MILGVATKGRLTPAEMQEMGKLFDRIHENTIHAADCL
jgi:hypothetical protein